MKTVLKMIEAHGGLAALKADYLRIENPPYMRLVIEHIGLGPNQRPLISVAHYFSQNGDAMRDPEMTFEFNTAPVTGAPDLVPITFQQDAPPRYDEAIFRDEKGLWVRKKVFADLKSFARLWDKNLKEQRFFEAFQRLHEEKLARYRGILALAADSPAKLRVCDVDRVLSEADDLDCLEPFIHWLTQQVSAETAEAIAAWTPDAKEPSAPPATEAPFQLHSLNLATLFNL